MKAEKPGRPNGRSSAGRARRVCNAMLQTELHRHLDVSIRSSTLLRLAQERGIEAKSTSLEAFRKKLLITEPMNDLGAVLAQFSLFPRVLDRPELLEQVAFECVED